MTKQMVILLLALSGCGKADNPTTVDAAPAVLKSTAVCSESLQANKGGYSALYRVDFKQSTYSDGTIKKTCSVGYDYQAVIASLDCADSTPLAYSISFTAAITGSAAVSHKIPAAQCGVTNY